MHAAPGSGRRGRPILPACTSSWWEARSVGRQRFGRFGQNQNGFGNTGSAECESIYMYDDSPVRSQRTGAPDGEQNKIFSPIGNQGRVAGSSRSVGGSVSSPGRTSVRQGGEPARGVMGGLLQLVSAPTEPPVPTAAIPFTGSPQAAPAPTYDLAGEFAPRAEAATAVGMVELTGRQHGSGGVHLTGPPG